MKPNTGSSAVIFQKFSHFDQPMFDLRKILLSEIEKNLDSSKGIVSIVPINDLVGKYPLKSYQLLFNNDDKHKAEFERGFYPGRVRNNSLGNLLHKCELSKRITE